MTQEALHMALEYLESRGLAWNVQIALREALAQEQKLIGTVGDLFDDRVIAHRKLDRDLLVYTAAP